MHLEVLVLALVAKDATDVLLSIQGVLLLDELLCPLEVVITGFQALLELLGKLFLLGSMIRPQTKHQLAHWQQPVLGAVQDFLLRFVEGGDALW